QPHEPRQPARRVSCDVGAPVRPVHEQRRDDSSRLHAAQMVGPMILALLSIVVVPQAPAVDRHGSLVDRFLAPDEQPLVSYRAERHLTASTRGGKMRGEMDVITSFDPERGFTFTIVSESGSSVIRRHVLLAALLTEQRTVASAARHEAALTRANYDFLAPSIPTPPF